MNAALVVLQDGLIASSPNGFRPLTGDPNRLTPQPEESSPNRCRFINDLTTIAAWAMLVLWGLFAEAIGLA